MAADRLADRVQEVIEREEAIDHWWASHKKALREMLERYKLSIAVDLRRTQIQLERTTEERDLLLKKLLKANETIARMKEILDEARE